jgi:UDP-glucose 4-epimerase
VSERDVIVHLAATVGVNRVMINSVETLYNNSALTKRILNVALKYNCKVFFASTSEVYGELTAFSSTENDPLVVSAGHCGRSAYVIGKLMSEHLCLNYYRMFGVPVIVGRFFNVTGIRQVGSYGMVVPTFITQALSGSPITLYGAGNQTRSFLNVKDAVQAILALLGKDGSFGEIFNIGSDSSITMLELAEYIKETANSSSSLLFLPAPEARSESRDIKHRKPSLQKITNYSGWQPSIDSRSTVEGMIKYESELRIKDYTKSVLHEKRVYR